MECRRQSESLRFWASDGGLAPRPTASVTLSVHEIQLLACVCCAYICSATATASSVVNSDLLCYEETQWCPHVTTAVNTVISGPYRSYKHLVHATLRQPALVRACCFQRYRLCLLASVRAFARCITSWSRREHPWLLVCLLYTSPSPRDRTRSRMPSSA